MSDVKNTILELIDPCTDLLVDLETYNKALSLAKDEEDFDLFRNLKLIELIEFTGTTNFDGSDMVAVLKLLEINKHNWDGRKNSIMEETAFCLDLPYNYICLIFCTLNKYELVEYGGSLQNAWITDNGIEILNPEYTVKYTKMLEQHLGYARGDKIIF